MESSFFTVGFRSDCKEGDTQAKSPPHTSPVFPQRGETHSECRYECEDSPGSDGGTVCAPVGAATGADKIGRGTKVDANADEGQCVARPGDMAERTGRMSDRSQTEMRDSSAPWSSIRNDGWSVGGERHASGAGDEERSKKEKLAEYMPMLGHRPYAFSSNVAVCAAPVDLHSSENGTKNEIEAVKEEEPTNLFLCSPIRTKAQQGEEEQVEEEKQMEDDAEADLFLSNTRLRSFDASLTDDAVTPLEKLLRESAPATTSPPNVSEDSAKAHNGFTHVHHPADCGAAAERPPVRLLVAQRHQLEIERRLAQRERDRIERALDARSREIRIPADAHAQLTYAPTRDFARRREAVLGALAALGTPPPGDPRAEAAADVSPISPRSFVQSPSPARGSPGALAAEALESKGAAGLAGLRQAAQLYQRLVAGMPQPRAAEAPEKSPAREKPPPAADAPGASAEFAAETYRRRLARIRELYGADGAGRTNAVFHWRRPLATPPLDFSTARSPSALIGRSPPAATREQQGARGDPHAVAQGWGPSPTYAQSNTETAGAMPPKSRAPHRRIMTPPLPPQEMGNVWDRGADAIAMISKPVLRWDTARSGNVLISQKGTTCLADASRALELVTKEAMKTGHRSPTVTIPMFALGTVGVSTGEFIFEVRIDAHPSSTTSKLGEFAVGVATKYYHNTHALSPAYLYRSNGTIVASADDEAGVPYGRPYQSGSHITVHLDLKKRQQSFFLNGKPLGVAFRFRVVEDPEPLFPLVLLSGEGDTASFVPPSPSYLPSHLKEPK